VTSLFTFWVRVLTALGLALSFGGLAQAQSTHTWVSGVGDDTYPCSRTAPCLTLAHALTQTVSGGQVSALDPGAFESGTIPTITQPVTIDGGTNGHLGAVASVDSLQINLTQPAAGGVILRNLKLNGFGGVGLNGIHIMSAGNVSIRNVDISGYAQNCVLVDSGANGAQVDVADSSFTNCSVGISNTGTAAISVGGSTVAFNSTTGLSSTNPFGAVFLFNSNISNNTQNTSIAVLATSPADPIPALPGLPPVAGISGQPTVLNLSGGQGPAMTSCLLTTVSNLFGVDTQYAGQSANGVAQFAFSGGRGVSFYPMQSSTFTGQAAPLNFTNSNLLNIGTSCGNFTVAPAISNPGEFGATLSGMGLTAQINAEGVITVMVGNMVFVARPDYLVTRGVPGGTPSLTQGADGLYRFTDSLGNTQILRPAFLDTNALAAQIQSASGLAGWLTFQTDGTALFTAFGGRQFVLTPDLTLTPAPAANAGMFYWQDASNHYFFRGSLLTLAQGLTVQQR